MCTVDVMEPVTPRSYAQPDFRPDSDQWTQWGMPDRPRVVCGGCSTSVNLYATPGGGLHLADHEHPERRVQCTGALAQVGVSR